jgi:hypothetical protein
MISLLIPQNGDNNTHKFIEDIMWKAQMEEKKKGVVDEITSAQLHIIKEALENMNYDYLELFMDRDLALKFIKDKEKEIGEICYHLILAHSSMLTTTKTSLYLVEMTHESMPGTHDLREDPLVTSPHEKYSGLQKSLDTKGFESAPILHCRDHETFILAQGLAAEIEVKKIPCGLANKEVYAPID